VHSPRLPALTAVALIIALLACAVGCTARDAEEQRVEVAHRLLADPAPEIDDVRHFVLDLDEGELRQLESSAGASDRAMLADPNAAVRAFGSALGLPANTSYELLEESDHAEEGPGAFLATFRASNPGGVLLLRLVSQPDADGRPTYWVINDVERLPSQDDLVPPKPRR